MSLLRPEWPITTRGTLLLTRPVPRLPAAPLPPTELDQKRLCKCHLPWVPLGQPLLTDHTHCVDLQHPYLTAIFKAAEGIIHNHFRES